MQKTNNCHRRSLQDEKMANVELLRLLGRMQCLSRPASLAPFVAGETRRKRTTATFETMMVETDDPWFKKFQHHILHVAVNEADERGWMLQNNGVH